MYLGCARWAIRRLAYVCRRSCSRTCRAMPACRRARGKRRCDRLSGSSGCPSRPPKTKDPCRCSARRWSARVSVDGMSMAYDIGSPAQHAPPLREHRASMKRQSGPKIAELGRDHLRVGHVALEGAHVAREAVHPGDEALRDRRVVIGEIAADELGDDLRLSRGEEPAADGGGTAHVFLQCAERLDDGAD